MITLPETLVLLALASKAALLEEADGVFTNEMERLQFLAATRAVRPILAKVDAENPGLIAIPHDGVHWKDRAD